MSTYLYYPGCSMEASAIAYHESLMQICGPLGITLSEIRDWNCCGATEYVGVSLTPAYSLIGRNLALAAKQANGCNTVLAPCSACYLNLAKADFYMRERPVLREKVNTALAAGGLHYDPGTLDIRHLLDIIINDVGLDQVRSKVVRPLKGLKVAPYLGCMVPRPDYKKRWSDHERPNELDRVLAALGAEVVDYPLRSHCCGGHMSQIGPDTAYELIRRLISSATSLGAHVMATLCPMCQMNVDAYQADTNRHFGTAYHMPVLFFTQLMGLAFGIAPEKLGFGREFVSASEAMKHVGVEVPPPPDEPVRRTPSRRDKTLPMPRMPGTEEVNK